LELIYWVVLPSIVFAGLAQYCGLRISELGLHSRIQGTQSVGFLIFISLLLCPVDYMIYSWALHAFQMVLPYSGMFQYHEVLPADGIRRTLATLYFAATAGVIEELYFRGLIYRACSSFRYPVAAYLLASPLLFALIHWESGAANTAACYVLGMFSAAVFLAFRNLWPLIVGHFFTDYVWLQ